MILLSIAPLVTETFRLTKFSLNPFKEPVRKKRHLLSSFYPSNHFLLSLSPYHGPGTLPRSKDLCFSVLLLMTVNACAQSLSGV